MVRITVSFTIQEARHLAAAGQQMLALVEDPCPCHPDRETREMFRGPGLRLLFDAVGALAQAVEAAS